MKIKPVSEHFQGRLVPLMGSLLKDIVFNLWENMQFKQMKCKMSRVKRLIIEEES